MKKRVPFLLVGVGVVIACATAETPEDLCNPTDESCRLSAGLGGDGDGDGDDAGMTGGSGGAAGGSSGSSSGGQAAGGSTGGTGGDETGGEGGEASGGGGSGGTGGASGDGGTGGTAPECVLSVDCDDDNECTDDACNAGVCENTDNTAGCTDDGEGCTDDVCDSGLCTHPALPDDTACTSDNEVCTDDVCDSGVCTHVNNTAPCSSDGLPCTDDVCSGGVCTHPNGTAACTDDGKLCTNDVCGGGMCTHPPITPCTGALIKILSNKNLNGRKYVIVKPDDYLEWSATTESAAEVFEVIYTATDQAKIRAQSTGKFVKLDNDTDDLLKADGADQASGATLGIAWCAATNGPPGMYTGACAPACHGIEVLSDTDGNKFVSAEDDGTMKARAGSCGNSNGSWESWQFIKQ